MEVDIEKPNLLSVWAGFIVQLIKLVETHKPSNKPLHIEVKVDKRKFVWVMPLKSPRQIWETIQILKFFQYRLSVPSLKQVVKVGYQKMLEKYQSFEFINPCFSKDFKDTITQAFIVTKMR